MLQLPRVGLARVKQTVSDALRVVVKLPQREPLARARAKSQVLHGLASRLGPSPTLMAFPNLFTRSLTLAYRQRFEQLALANGGGVVSVGSEMKVREVRTPPTKPILPNLPQEPRGPKSRKPL